MKVGGTHVLIIGRGGVQRKYVLHNKKIVPWRGNREEGKTLGDGGKRTPHTIAGEKDKGQHKSAELTHLLKKEERQQRHANCSPIAEPGMEASSANPKDIPYLQRKRKKTPVKGGRKGGEQDLRIPANGKEKKPDQNRAAAFAPTVTKEKKNQKVGHTQIRRENQINPMVLNNAQGKTRQDSGKRRTKNKGL